MEALTKIKNRQLAIAEEMLQAVNNPALDARALKARIVSYRRQILVTTAEIGVAIASLDPDITLPMEN
jgi:outer membrane protein TolC